MKTTKKVFRKMIQLNLLVLFVIATQSCETEIPPEDPTPPEFVLQIRGDGFFHEFNQDSDFDNIELKLIRSKTYDFIYMGSDEGGIDRVQWNILPARKITITSNIPAPWISSYVNDNQNIIWKGDRSNPKTASAFDGSFFAPYDRHTIVFRFNVTDFGGETTNPNEITKELTISTGNIGHEGVVNL